MAGAGQSRIADLNQPALWRAEVAPRWVGPVLGVFLVVEFAGQAISEWASLLSVVLYLAAFTALAVTMWRSPAATWSSRAHTGGVPAPASRTPGPGLVPTDS